MAEPNYLSKKNLASKAEILIIRLI